MRKRIALKDIASEVGVSTALVSYVLNDRQEEMRVGKDMADKIRKVAQELGYRPNQIAKSLKTKKTHTIGFIVADINYRFTTGVTRAIEAACQKFNYTVIFGSSEENPKKFSELVDVLVTRQVDGLIIVPVEDCENEINFLHTNEIPFVLIDRIIPTANANTIAIDNVGAAYQQTMHLIKTRHKRIALITYKTTLVHLLDRQKGYMEALNDSGMYNHPDLIKELSVNHGTEEMKKAIEELLAMQPPCDAIFFATDTLAVEGLRVINMLKIKIPDQLGIVSFDKSEAFELFYCPITHGDQPLEDIGRIAVNTLIDVINHSKNKRKIVLESNFIVGKSCGEK